MEIVVLAVVTLIAAMIFGTATLLARLARRGPALAVTVLDHTARSLFGPSGSPESVCRSLIDKHPELRPGAHGGCTFVGSGCRGRLDFIAGSTEIRFELDH